MQFLWVAFLLIIISGWWALPIFGLSGDMFPTPIDVGTALFVFLSTGELMHQMGASLMRLFFGLFIGVFIGIIVGVVIGRSSFLDALISPVLNVIRAFPPVAIIPLVIIWFGINDSSKIFSISLAVFFPVWVSAYTGAKRIPADYINAAKLLTKSKVKRLLLVILPASFSHIISGIRIGIAMAYIMVFVSELSGASVGLGFYIANAQITYRVDNLIAGLIVLGLLAALTDGLFTKSMSVLFPWLRVGDNNV